MINNIKNNAISEALAKQKLDALNETRKVETKNKRLINGQKILLNLFDDLIETIYFVNKENNNNNNNNNIVVTIITIKILRAIIVFLIHMGFIKLLYTCLVIFFER